MMSQQRMAKDGSNSVLQQVAVLQQDDGAKSAEPTTRSDTTQPDLPYELVERILIEAIAMEVKDMKLARRVWKEKADLVICRLKTVCLHWCSILENAFFRDRLHMILDDTAQETIRMEILHRCPLQLSISICSITTKKDEVFLLGKRYRLCHTITVYDRNNMAEVKDVISLSGLHPYNIAACSVSDCIYVLNRKLHRHYSILCITKDGDHWSTVTVLINDICLHVPTLCVTASGNLIVSSQQTEKLPAISVFNADGSMQREIWLSEDVSVVTHVILKSNGNLVLAVRGASCKLIEIDLDGNIIRQYDSNTIHAASYADSYGRVLTFNYLENMKLFDAEFNLMDFTGPQLDGGDHFYPNKLHYNSERNELVTVESRGGVKNALVIFRFMEI